MRTKKRSYGRVVVGSMSPAEKKKYRKRLAYVRKYTQLRREWAKKVRAGTLDKGFSFAQYRSAKLGYPKAVKHQAEMEKIRAHSFTEDSPEVEKLQRLINEIKRGEEAKAVAQTLREIK